MKGANSQLPKLRPDVRLYLFHGTDEAGAADLARRLAATLPDAEHVDLDGATLKRNPGLLADEAASLSLFGDARLIRAAPIGEESLEALTLLLDAERTGNPVIATAPGVKASGKVVKLALDNPRAVSVACYEPSAADLDKATQAMLVEHGLRPEHGLARRVAELAGGDRAVIAREIDKLALYLDAAPDRPHDATLADLDAIGADLGDSEQDAAIDALLEGRPGELGVALVRLNEGGASPISWLRALQRRLMSLGDIRTALDRGDQMQEVFKRYRLFGPRADQATRDLRRWSPAMIAAALARVRESELAAVASGNPGAVAAEHAAVDLARRLAERQ